MYAILRYMDRALEIALGEYGQLEVPGTGDNPRIVEYHSATAAGAAEDTIPWCSSFVNWAHLQAGRPRTKSKAAKSWLNFGLEMALKEALPGDFVVLRRPAGRYHVGFFFCHRGDRVYILGGNQKNEVNIARFMQEKVLYIGRAHG